MDMEEKTLATELLHELKMSAKRWFIAFIVMVVLEILTIGGFLWYVTLPVEEYTYEQEANDRGFNVINGEVQYGSTSESDIP